MTGSIAVCPLSRLPETLARSGAGSVVSLLARDQRASLPGLAGLRHLALDVSDITAPLAGHRLASADHLGALLSFVRDWDRARPLLIHCYAGVSRSTAACYAAVCALDDDADEGSLARRLRAASPNATPNPRIVALADAALGRGGRMVDAVGAIGRGRDCYEGDVFTLAVASPPPQVPARWSGIGAAEGEALDVSQRSP